jgi:hypothetical protein
MGAFQNVSIGIAVVLVAMACMVFGDWLARGKRQPNYWYCQNAERPERHEIEPTKESAATDQEKARKTANERHHELCNQWRQAEAAEESAHVAWLQLWFGLAGLGGLLATIYFAGRSARAASDAAVQMAREVDIQIRIEQPHLRVSSIVTKIDPQEDWRQVDLLVQNLGKTAAVLIEWVVQCEVLPTLPKTPRYRDPVNMRGRILRADDKGMDLPIFLSETDADAVYSRQETVYLWGYFRYEDVFGRLRKSGFGYIGGPMGEEPGVYIGVLWSRTGGKAYNYDEDEPG